MTINLNGTSKDPLNGSIKAPIAEFDEKEEMETLLMQVKVVTINLNHQNRWQKNIVG